MIIAHKFVDHVLRKGKLEASHKVKQETLRQTVELLAAAEKFDFGDLPLEPGAEDGRYRLPEVTADELEAFSEGLIPLPAQACWCEYNHNRSREVMLAVALTPTRTFVTAKSHLDETWLLGPRMALDWQKQQQLVQFTSDEVEETKVEVMADLWTGAAHLVTWLTLMLNSRSTEKVWEHAPEKLNRSAGDLARACKGDSASSV